jgi:PAS domain S-box-containing protein
MKDKNKSSQKSTGSKRSPSAKRTGSSSTAVPRGCFAQQAAGAQIAERKRTEEELKESEQKYKLLIEATNTGYVIIDEKGLVLDANKEYVRMTGRGRLEDILGRPVTDWTASYDLERNEAEVRKCMKSGSVRNLLVDYVDEQGKITPVEINATVLPGPPFARIFTVCRDITVRKRSEDALRESEENFRALVETSYDWIWAVDENGVYTYASPRVKDILGYSAEEVVGKTPFDFMHPKERERVVGEFGKIVANKEPLVALENINRHRDGREVILETSGMPVFDPRGGFKGYRGIDRDVTARKEAENALRASENRTRSIIESLPIGVHMYHLEPDGRLMFTGANPAADKILGVDNSVFIGKSIEEAFPRLNATEVPRRYREAAASGKSWHTESIDYHEGSIRGAFEVQAFQTAPDTMVAAFEDITARKKSELALKESEVKYRRLYNETPVLLHSIDRNGNLVDVNDYWLKIMGYKRNEVIGRKTADFFTDASRKYAEEVVLPSFFRDGIVRDIPYQFVKKNGEVLDVLLSATAERDTAGNVVRSLAVIEDITERKRAEEALRENQERLDLALQSAHMGVWRWEIKEDRRYFDDLTCQVLGIEATKFSGTAAEFYGAVHPEDREKLKAALARTLEHDVLYEPSYRVVWLDGSVRYITSRGRLVRDDKGQPARIYGILWDITDQRRLEQELIESEKLESIGTLAGGIAHDFNNLLQGVFGFISMAKLTFDQKEKSLAMLMQAEKALHQSVNLTSQLLTFSKGGKPVKKVFALRPLIENSVAFALSGSRVTYKMVFDENLRVVEADEGQIGQVIQNIILNADQAMPLGGMIQVSVRNITAAAIVPYVDLQGDLVEISIRDQGTGIPAEHLTRVFDPYFTTKEKGSGLGLATSYSIVKNHGGLVRVQSEVGKGTTFFIYLPASAAKGEETDRPAIPATTRTGRILVMDDEEMIRTVAGELLTTVGHEVAFAEKGETALEVYRAARDAGHPFDVVILDLTIRGGMGGLETLQKLTDIDPDVKAVVSSGYSDDAALSNYREQGFKAFLKKPYNMEELQNTLNALFV